MRCSSSVLFCNPKYGAIVSSKAPQQTQDQRVTILLKNYEELIALYKFWFDLTVKVNFYQFLIAGSILSFVFSANKLGSNALVGLWVPVISGAGIAGMYLVGSHHQFQLDEKLGEIRKELTLLQELDIRF